MFETIEISYSAYIINLIFPIVSMNFRSELPPERAGGYKCALACQRALQEAMQGLFYGNPPT